MSAFNKDVDFAVIAGGLGDAVAISKEDKNRTFSMVAAGLGDAIAMSGAACFLANQGLSIQFFTHARNIPSVESFFLDYPAIKVEEYTNSPSEKVMEAALPSTGTLRAPTHVDPDIVLDMYHRTYMGMNIDYFRRWDNCPIREAALKYPQVHVDSDDYIFLHHDPTRNLYLDREKLPKGTAYFPEFQAGRSILAFKDAIENARRLDVMDSCFFHFAEQLAPKGKLFLHRYPKPYCPGFHDFATRHEWIEVW